MELPEQLHRSLVQSAGHRLLTLAAQGITFSEEESRQIIEEEYPELPEEVVAAILRKAGFP